MDEIRSKCLVRVRRQILAVGKSAPHTRIDSWAMRFVPIGKLRTASAKTIEHTIHTDKEDITSALLGRCNAYLVKPIDTAKLKKELKALGLIQ
jgi:CheY-like chemotaxis protein